MDTFAIRLRAAREHAELSQTQLANLLNIRQQTLSGWELGKPAPNRSMQLLAAWLTGVRPAWLILGAGPMLAAGVAAGEALDLLEAPPGATLHDEPLPLRGAPKPTPTKR